MEIAEAQKKLAYLQKTIESVIVMGERWVFLRLSITYNLRIFKNNNRNGKKNYN